MRYLVPVPIKVCHRCARSFNVAELAALAPHKDGGKACHCLAHIDSEGTEEQLWMPEAIYRWHYPDSARRAVAVPETARERVQVMIGRQLERALDFIGARLGDWLAWR